MKRTASAALLGLAAALLPLTASGQEVDPFYRGLLEDGIRSGERGDYLEASEELRIAAFGLMDSPPELARALTHLALAQRAGGDTESFARTLRRLARLETRFGAYSTAHLESAARAALDQAARALLPAEELRSSPLFASQPEAAPPAPAAETPTTQAKLCISWTAGGECRQPGTAARPGPGPEPGPAQESPRQPADLSSGPLSTAAPSSEEQADLDRLSGLAAGKGGSKKLREGFELARTLADLHPAWPEAQRVAGLLAARSASYPEAVTYYRRSGQIAEDRPVELFYLAVALFETDEVEEAAEALRRALPGLEQNREVRRYVRRILPADAQG